MVRDFTIITGQGKHSRRAFEPVLRPAAQDMFLEEFDPPIVSRFEPKNLGRLKVGWDRGKEGGEGGREGGRGQGRGGGRGGAIELFSSRHCVLLRFGVGRGGGGGSPL